ncbi:hypothetical protein B0H13DRAFT_1857218 [Mycena leptocephala]|nr:hypothetical protein B0H13DRAFT_1905125 [Mycena leptocephala]KAJ7932091.1 hypothetical protein B0H13DRAFT_1857218 [Mycena leptocephala]
MAKITVLATSTLWAVLDPVDAGPVGESVGAEGEGEMGAAPPPVIAEGDISAEAAKDVVTVGGALDEVVGELLAMELEGGKDAVIVGGALGEVKGDLSAKELEGRKCAVPVGGVLGKSTCVSLGDSLGFTHGTLHNDEAATRLRQLVTHGESEIEVGMEAIGMSSAVRGVDRPGDKGKETENEELHGISMRELQRGSTENKETPNAGVTTDLESTSERVDARMGTVHCV